MVCCVSSRGVRRAQTPAPAHRPAPAQSPAELREELAAAAAGVRVDPRQPTARGSRRSRQGLQQQPANLRRRRRADACRTVPSRRRLRLRRAAAGQPRQRRPRGGGAGRRRRRGRAAGCACRSTATRSAMSKIFNPDIAVIGNFLGAAGENEVEPAPALELDEAEAQLPGGRRSRTRAPTSSSPRRPKGSRSRKGS